MCDHEVHRSDFDLAFSFPNQFQVKKFKSVGLTHVQKYSMAHGDFGLLGSRNRFKNPLSSRTVYSSNAKLL